MMINTKNYYLVVFSRFCNISIEMHNFITKFFIKNCGMKYFGYERYYFIVYLTKYIFREKGWFPHVEVSGMSFQQSIEAPVTLRDTITLSGHLSTQNGTGQGSMNVSCRRLLSER